MQRIHSTRRFGSDLGTRLTTTLGCLGLLLAAVASASDPFAEGPPLADGAAFEAPTELGESHGVRVPIRHLGEPIVTLSNTDAVETRRVEVVAIDAVDHQHRRHTLLIEAGGSSVLGLESTGGFDELVLQGDGPFEATLEDALVEGVHALEVLPNGSRVAAARGRAAKKSTVCDGTWQLSCISPASCTYTSAYESGRVEDFDQVYWKLHTPTGAWTTTGSGCSTTWYGIQSNGCPGYAYNCYGQTFAIDHDLPSGPDLVISNISLSSSSVTSGNNVTVTYDVWNVGSSTVTPRYQERFRLKPSSGSANEVFVSSTYGQDIAPGATVTRVMSVPVFGPSGSYDLQIEADFGKAVSEGNESNNMTSIPLTINQASGAQVSILGMIYNPGSGHGHTLALQNCTQNVNCSRTFQLVNTGSSSAYMSITDNSDPGTSVSDNCPTYLSSGSSCTLTIQHTLVSPTAREWSGDVSIYLGTPSQSEYEICIEDDDFLCR